MESAETLSDLCNEHFLDIWSEGIVQCDVRSAPNIFREYIQYRDQAEGIKLAIHAAEIWRTSWPEFFNKFRYSWMFDPKSFDFASEAAFQVRALELAIPIYNRRDEYDVKEKMFGEIAVRQIVVPRMEETPRATLLATSNGAHGFILMPSGWFDSMHYGLEAPRHVTGGDLKVATGLIEEVVARIIADRVIFDVHVHLETQLAVDPIVMAACRPAIARKVCGDVSALSRGVGDLDPDTILPGLWGDMAYATCNFALAHEVAHVLASEHLYAASGADESRADDIAFDMMALSRAWQDRCVELPVRTPIGKTCMAAAGFIFVNWLQLAGKTLFGGDLSRQEEEFRKRAEHIQIAAAVQKFPDAERTVITDFSAALTGARKIQLRLAENMADVDMNGVLQAGADYYLALLKEQSVLGGVSGL